MKGGNGENIRVWGDKWLPTTSTYKVASLRQFLNSDTRVSELINLDTASWKSEIIDALFLPFEADIIKSIPLSSRLPVDKQLWAESSNGLFSVRSAYAVAMRMSQKATNGAPLDSNQQRGFRN